MIEAADRTKIDILKSIFKKKTYFAAFDFDDTLILTREMFANALVDVVGLLNYGRDWLLVKENSDDYQDVANYKSQVVDTIVNSLRSEFGINPAVMTYTSTVLAKLLATHKNTANYSLAIQRVKRLYESDVPEVFTGARETIVDITEAGLIPLLMTHAQEEWTTHKKRVTNFVGVFAKTICFDIGSPKSEQWKIEFEKLKIDPQSVVVFGDNFNADIRPNLDLGAKGVWITNKRTEIYGGEKIMHDPLHYQNENLVVVDSVDQSIAGIINKWAV